MAGATRKGGNRGPLSAENQEDNGKDDDDDELLLVPPPPIYWNAPYCDLAFKVPCEVHGR